jgi:hypothetical protein
MPSYAGSNLHASTQPVVPLTRSISTEMTASISPINCPVVSRSLGFDETDEQADSPRVLASDEMNSAYRSVIVRFWTAVRQFVTSAPFAGSSSGPYSQAKSSVTPKGVPSSSLRAYRFPIEVLESSTREKIPALRSFDAVPKQ